VHITGSVSVGPPPFQGGGDGFDNETGAGIYLEKGADSLFESDDSTDSPASFTGYLEPSFYLFGAECQTDISNFDVGGPSYFVNGSFSAAASYNIQLQLNSSP